MSLYCFLASEKKLPPLSVGIDDQGYRIIIEDERHVLNIFEGSPNCHTEPYTSMPAIMDVEIGIDFATVENDMISYVERAMVGNSRIELWWTWMGDSGETECRAVPVNELALEDLRWVFGGTVYTHPKCLKVYKWTKGKR